jgi:hypothetical protein
MADAAFGPPEGLIVPKTVEAVTYDPALATHADLIAYADRVAAEVRSDIIAQGLAIEQGAERAGWTHVPPQHRDPAALEEMARDVHMRLCWGVSWRTLASDRLLPLERASVAGRVKRWIAGLGLHA